MNPSGELVSRAKEIEKMTKDFCKEYLTEEYAKLCVKLIEKVLHSDSAEALMAGRANTIAGGVLQVIAANNFLFKSKTRHVNAEKIAKFCGIGVGTVGAKARLIRNAAKVEREYDPVYATDEALKNNMIIGIRTQFNVYSRPQSDSGNYPRWW